MRRISPHDPSPLDPLLTALGVSREDAIAIKDHALREKFKHLAIKGEEEIGDLVPWTPADGIHGDHQFN